MIRHGGNKAYDSATPDVVVLPAPEAFKDAESYEATKAHKMTRWSKHETRLNLEFTGSKRFAGEAYARQGLVAELRAALLYADLGITPEHREDHASYIHHWL